MALPNASTPISCQLEKESLENDAPIEGYACKDVNKEKTESCYLPPVSPFSSGVGLPYAPEGWPNPGDVWSWKVGRRTNKGGYFHDRYLYPPKSLHISNRKGGCFQSKPDVVRYLESNFPNMRIETFFALFNWQVPSSEQFTTKAVPLSTKPPMKSVETGEDATEEVGTHRRIKRRANICSPQPTRKSFRVQSRSRVPRIVQDENEIIDLCYLKSTEDLNDTSDSEVDQPSPNRNDHSENSVAAVCNLLDSKEETAGEKDPNGIILENFDDYLDNLEDLLVLPPTEATPSDPATTLEIEMVESCKKNLSSILAVDFASLVSSNNAMEAAKLASQISKDPNISVDQLEKLKLVEQIPLFSEAFHEAQGKIEEADKFFADLEAKTLRVPSLKKEYNEVKEELAGIEAEIEKSSLAINEIDDQISQLESKRKDMFTAFETMQQKKFELSSRKTTVANSIPTIVNEIHQGISEKPKWELKKASFAKRVADINDKFITLKGLHFN